MRLVDKLRKAGQLTTCNKAVIFLTMYTTKFSKRFTLHCLSKTGDNDGSVDNGSDDDDTNIAVIAGAVAGGCVLLIFVVLVIIFYRR